MKKCPRPVILSDVQVRALLNLVALAWQLVRDMEADQQPPQAVEYQLLMALNHLEAIGFPSGESA